MAIISNIRTKLAYICMLIGLFLFLFGIVNLALKLLNLHQSEHENYLELREEHKLFKLQQKQKYKSGKWLFKDINPNLNNNHKFFEFASKYIPINFANSSSIFIWFCSVNSSTNRKSNLIMINLKENERTRYYDSKLADALNYIICSSENIYIFFLIILCILGLITLIYGCSTFYKYNIKLNEPIKTIIIADNNSYETIEHHKKSKWKFKNCLKSLLGHLKFKADKKSLIKLDEETVEVSEVINDQMPFIYDDIPKYKAYNTLNSPILCSSYERKFSGMGSPCYTKNKNHHFFVRINESLIKENLSREYFV